MSSKHSKRESKSSLIIISVVCVVVIAAIICMLIFLNPDKALSQNPTSQTEITKSSEITEPDSEQYETDGQSQFEQETVESTIEQGYTSSIPASTEKVIVPTISGEEQGNYFGAEFIPYRAIDTFTGNNTSLREVFGSSYKGGKIQFNVDGTFYDTLSLTSVNSGAYAVEGNTIVITYTNDKNIIADIVASTGEKPSEISINYGGYQVYFN